ncbi:MAG: SGNH/GDSL hydrolase family protein [Phycisphaerales bacterium JB063]
MQRQSKVRRGVLTLGLGLGLGLFAGAAYGQSYSEVVVFGDSLSDVGNTANSFLISLFSPQAQPPYYEGRFSNGPVWAEHLAQSLDLDASVRSTAGGLNYAWGGALSGDGTNFFGLVDNLGGQVDDYLDSHTPTGDELFLLWGGANDLIEIGGSLGELFSGSGTPQSVSDNMAGHMHQLAAAGAQNILVLNLPNLGDIPRYAGTTEQQSQNAVAQDYNNLLAAQVAAVETQYTIDIDLLDISALVELMLNDPARYGFTNTTDPAYDTENDQVVPDPAGYVFWDDIHPGALAHEWIATAARVQLLEQGDLNGDGFVGAQDLDILLARWGDTVTPFDTLAGDWNGDGTVGQADLDIVQAHWGAGTPPGANVPEPASAAGLLAIAFVFTRRRRRTI